MTVTEIAAAHDVSRQTIHTYRRTGVFPPPVEGEGSTRLRFREDEVAAFFEANPKQPRKKRRYPHEQQGEPAVIQEQVTKPDYLTDEQWSAFVFGILGGVVKGAIDAGLNGSWGMDLATAAVKGARARLDELAAEEAADGSAVQ
jgi:hypothetical protein